MPLRALLVFVAFITHTLPAQATTVVIIWTATKAFIAADSMVVRTTTSNTSFPSTHECKVVSTEKPDCCTAAIQGTMSRDIILANGGREAVFDLRHIVSSAIGSSKSSAEAAYLAAKEIEPLLDKIEVAYDMQGPHATCEPNCSMFNIQILGIKADGTIEIMNVAAPTGVASRGKPRLTVSTKPTLSGMNIACSGKCEEVFAEFKLLTAKSIYIKYGEEAVALVQKAAASHPSEVGEPISLTVVSQQGGVDWRLPGACQTSNLKQ